MNLRGNCNENRWKIERYLKESSKKVELTDDNYNQEDISAAWPHGITYEGRPIFDAYIHAIPNMTNILKKKYKESDGQETYLGYNPNNEQFYCGYDWSIRVGWSGTGDEEDWQTMSPIFSLTFDNGKFVVGKLKMLEMRFYDHDRSGGHEWLHKNFPGMIDLRLD